MTGADIIAALLIADENVGGLIAAGSIKLGRLPDAITLPVLLVRTVSSVDNQPLKRGPLVRVTDRVAVTVRAASYRDQVAAIKLVRTCCAGRVGDLGGALRVSILTAGIGPDVNGPADSFEQTQDFRVSFDEPA
ncbi:hypothetical protein [Sphingomonas sp. GC_Shp_3]|uniref:hypothetical protein n=1 Tax=Sphingomonas sp. GC_Shp_3 TaxID=2937383 RepID=UPI00226AB711|nr:hypothetical protein [Sphingomonas sp. GC_Shp_3]